MGESTEKKIGSYTIKLSTEITDGLCNTSEEY